jgi:hypothetical protein
MITKAAAQPPILGIVKLSALFANECAATSVLFTFHKPCKQLVCSLPFNPKFCVPSLSSINNACKNNIITAKVLFWRHLNRQRSNLLCGC